MLVDCMQRSDSSQMLWSSELVYSVPGISWSVHEQVDLTGALAYIWIQANCSEVWWQRGLRLSQQDRCCNTVQCLVRLHSESRRYQSPDGSYGSCRREVLKQ